MRLRSGLSKNVVMIGGNVTEKITPETYEKMNEEFIKEDMNFRWIVPTQKQIDRWQKNED
jgi:hypothetical protein